MMKEIRTIPFITGDGVGPEITPACQAVTDAAILKAYKGNRTIEWLEVQAGESSFNQTGNGYRKKRSKLSENTGLV